MKLPALFHGLYRDVKRRTAKIVTRIRKGDDWIALVEAEGLLDVDTTPGLVVMKGPSSLLGGKPHFQAWLLWLQFRAKALDEDRQDLIEAVFQQSLTRPWSTLGLVSYQNHPWFYAKHRYRPFLRAVREYWHIYAAVGARYSYGVPEPVDLWTLNNSIHYVLANLGIPGDDLRAPLPPGGLAELIDRTEAHLH
ncbi:hypothetical protein [Haliangium sp.]|uniref:hypothetical protein n=1 Tax=Haliangium sp. TaxID=2663208 RepID=UPI003D106BE2